jgi:general nucleoside transport system permease protein
MIRLRLERRSETPAWLNLALPVVAIVATLILCSGLVALAHANVLDAYRQLFLTPFSTSFDLVQTAVKSAPLVLTGLAVAVAFRARFWNIGGEGQLYAGAMAAAFVGTQNGLPAASLWPLMFVGGALAGAAWALLPALLRTRFRVDDVVTTLLLNFILLYGMSALLDGPWKNPQSAYPTSPPIREDAQFPVLPGTSELHLGVLVALLAAPAIWFLVNRTTLGFAIKAVGENAAAAAYAGIRTGRIIMATAGISGALAGLAGVGEVGGVHYQVMADLSPGYGYTGIVIAMLARLNPLGTVPAAIFFAVVITGAEGMSRATGVPVFLADVIQGVSLLSMLTALLFTQYRLRLARPAHA